MLIINLLVSIGTLVVDTLGNSTCKESPTLKRNTHTLLNTQNPILVFPIFCSVMVDQVFNLSLTMSERSRIFSWSDESGIDLFNPNPHSQPFVPITTSRLPK